MKLKSYNELLTREITNVKYNFEQRKKLKYILKNMKKSVDIVK